MKKFLLIISVIFSMTSGLQAQDYENAVGLRLGPSNGVSFKHFFTTNDAAEGILTARWGGFNLTGLVERHTSALKTDGLYFFYGAGAHFGSFNNSWFNDTSNHLVIGIDGILGFEYVFSEIPVNVSLDWKPGINLIGYTGFWSDEIAFTARYTF
jgi:hypothetical protein